jgi:hypothetical protein
LADLLEEKFLLWAVREVRGGLFKSPFLLLNAPFKRVWFRSLSGHRTTITQTSRGVSSNVNTPSSIFGHQFCQLRFLLGMKRDL